ncbi:MAG: hypothetical protein IJ760_00395 [Bacteroidales bacterium]|nr:hypothetical protein [Bacteroidales bacterium]
MIIRKAALADVDRIMQLVQSRIDWMNLKGLHQWNETDYFGRYPRSYWEEAVGSFMVGEDQGCVVVAVALYPDDVRWTRDGQYTGALCGKAVYLHHLVSDPSYPGAGRDMMVAVEALSKARGINLLRLDSAVGNTVLERYYSALGYSPCGLCHDRLYHGVLREKQI